MAHQATQPADCANCHYAFVPGEPCEFFPHCGQQNHAVEISFGHVVEEFLEGIFYFDGKVFRTAGLLLFRPGELTRRFLAGQRVLYVPPIRLYFISFVFFLLLGTVFNHGEEEAPEQIVKPAATKKTSFPRSLPMTTASRLSDPKAGRAARKDANEAIRKALAATVDSLAAAPATPEQQNVWRLRGVYKRARWSRPVVAGASKLPSQQ